MIIDVDGRKFTIVDFLPTDTYFEMTKIDPKALKEQTYFLLINTVTAPVLNEDAINKLPVAITLKLSKQIREALLPDDLFLELGVQLDKPLQE